MVILSSRSLAICLPGEVTPKIKVIRSGAMRYYSKYTSIDEGKYVEPQTPQAQPAQQPSPSPATSNGMGDSGSGKHPLWSWPPSKKTIRIVIGLILVIILLIVVIARLAPKEESGNKGSETTLNLKPGTLNGPYYEREGYPRKEVGPAIGDALGLIMKKNNKAAKVGDAITYPACAVITQSDISKAGLRPQANGEPSGIAMSYVDGRGSGAIPYGKYSIPLSADSNRCRYSIPDGSIILTVYQPYMVSEYALNYDLERNFNPATIDGIGDAQAYTIKPEVVSPEVKTTSRYYIRKDANLAFQLSVNYPEADRQAKTESLIKTALANLARLATSPEGAPIASYQDSPPYKDGYLRACNFLDDQGLQALVQLPASAFVKEEVANSTSVVQFNKLKDDNFYLYVQNQCSRTGAGSSTGLSAGGNAPIRDPDVTVQTFSYSDKKAAEQHISAARSLSKESISLPNIGDGGTVLRTKSGANEFIFRTGRYVITVTLMRISQRGSGLDDQAKYSKVMVPYAEYILKRIGQQ